MGCMMLREVMGYAEEKRYVVCCVGVLLLVLDLIGSRVVDRISWFKSVVVGARVVRREWV